MDKLIQVRTVECTGCMTCVESCPVASTLTFSLRTPTGSAETRRGTLSGMAMTLLVLGIMFAIIAFAMLMGVWDSPVPEQLYFRLIPEARMIGH